MTDPQRFMAELAEACGTPLPECAPERLFLNWDEAREMVRGGMAVGSHTHSHPLLAKLSAEEQRCELATSRDILTRELGAAVRTLAFPVGSPAAFNETTKNIAREAGYDAAFSYYGGFNRSGQMDRYDVRRESVDADVSVDRLRLRIALLSRFGRAI